VQANLPDRSRTSKCVICRGTLIAAAFSSAGPDDDHGEVIDKVSIPVAFEPIVSESGPHPPTDLGRPALQCPRLSGNGWNHSEWNVTILSAVIIGSPDSKLESTGSKHLDNSK
jgi:hypothetical protein